MYIKRRQFLQSGSLAAAGTMLVPKFLSAYGKTPILGNKNKILVVIQLSGGNDGLNTIIPVRNDIYYKNRPKLGIKQTDALTLNDDTGIHPKLTQFKDLYDQGELCIINNVGYPNPDRSHFRSMDIWHSASNSSDYWNTGWLGRYLDSACNGCQTPTQILEIDDVLSLALKGEQYNGLALTDPKKLRQASNTPYFSALAADHHDHEPMADYLYKTLTETLQSADYLYKSANRTTNNATYPNTELGRSLSTVSSLILGDANTSVYYTSLGSFDTHIGQENTQNRLFTEMNDAVAAFVKDLKKNNRFEDVMLVTFSEFGRRVAQNASGGTDHGTANNMFVIAQDLKTKGLYNQLPNLSDLDNGDLKHQIDFRQVYTTLLNNWLQVDGKQILQGSFDSLKFV